MKERTKTIDVKMIKIENYVDKKNKTHKPIFDWYLSEMGDEILITCFEGVSYFPNDKGEIEIDFYEHTGGSRSIMPTYAKSFSISELKSMATGDYIPLHTIVRRHPRVDNNYNDTISYLEQKKFNVYDIKETSNV